MSADLIAKIVGILAVIGFTSIILGFLFVSYMLIDSWTTHELYPRDEDKELFNAFEEADKKQKETNDGPRTAYSRTGISRS